MKKSIFKNSIFNIAYKLLNVLFPMITAMYVARILQPEGVGKVGYAQNILSYFTVIASMGIPTYGAREIARVVQDKKKTDLLFSELFLLNLFSTVLCSVAYLIVVAAVPSFRGNAGLYIVVGIQLFLNIFNIDWYYSGNEEYVYITVRSTVIKIISIICIFLFVRDIDDLLIYALINALAVSVNYVFNVFNLRGRVSLQWRNLNFKQHLKPVVVLLFTVLATDLYNQVAVTMMGGMCTEAEIGYYTYAIKLVRIVTSVATALAITTLPRMSQYFAGHNDAEFHSLFQKTLNAMLVLVIPCTIGIMMVAEDAVLLVYGESFMPSANILRISAPIFVIIAISYQCGSVVLTAVNKEKGLLAATLTGVALNFVLNLFLIPKYAGDGAAFASVVAEVGVLAVHVFCARKYIKWQISARDLRSLIVASLALVIVVFAMQIVFAFSTLLSLAMPVFAGGCAYAGLLLLQGNSTAVAMKNKFFRK